MLYTLTSRRHLVLLHTLSLTYSNTMYMLSSCIIVFVDLIAELTSMVSRGVARISVRGFPKSLGNEGAGEWCATRARILAVRKY